MTEIEELRKAAHARHEAETGAFINDSRITIVVSTFYTDGTITVERSA